MQTATAELTQLVETGAQQMIAALRAAAAEDGSVEGLTGLLEIAFRQRNQIDAAVTEVIAALDRTSRTAAEEGGLTMGLSPANWLAHTLHISRNAAHAQVHLARQLPALPETAAAFQRGDLSARHASVVARSVEQVTRGGGDADRAENLLLQEAERRDPKDLLRWGLGLLHRLAPREMEAQEERLRQRRYLHLSEVFDGGYTLQGYLDPIAGAKFKTALNGILGPRARGDLRSPGQRRADGLEQLVDRVLDSGKLPVRGGQRPHLTLTTSLETLRGDDGAPAALLDWTWPISGTVLRRIATNAEMTPIVLSAEGDPLYVGRKYRTATPKMRKALAARDKRCVWPGCDAPPEWWQSDHEKPWTAGGETNVDNMRVLCGKHNRMLSRGWRLERTADGWTPVPPAGRSPRPRRSAFRDALAVPAEPTSAEGPDHPSG